MSTCSNRASTCSNRASTWSNPRVDLLEPARRPGRTARPSAPSSALRTPRIYDRVMRRARCLPYRSFRRPRGYLGVKKTPRPSLARSKISTTGRLLHRFCAELLDLCFQFRELLGHLSARHRQLIFQQLHPRLESTDCDIQHPVVAKGSLQYQGDRGTSPSTLRHPWPRSFAAEATSARRR